MHVTRHLCLLHIVEHRYAGSSHAAAINKKGTKKAPFLLMVEAAGIEPASVSSPPCDLHAYTAFNLTDGNPTGRVGRQPVRKSFDAKTPNVSSRELAIGYPRVGRTSTNLSEGYRLVFKQLKRSCRRWQL